MTLVLPLDTLRTRLLLLDPETKETTASARCDQGRGPELPGRRLQLIKTLRQLVNDEGM